MKKTIAKSKVRKAKKVETKIPGESESLLFKNKPEDLKNVAQDLVNDLNCLSKHFHELVQKQATKHNIKLNTQIFFEVC